MANADRPMGFSPVKMITGAPYNGQATLYAILAADTNGYAMGDPVTSDAGGGSAEGIPAVTIGVAGSAWRGVIVGIFDTKPGIAKIDNPNTTVRPAAAQSKDWYAMVVDDPNVIFEVQEVSGGTALTAADIGLNANGVAGTNNGYVSGWELNNTTEATTATLNCKILGLVQRADNAIGEHAKWLVKINNHQLASGTGTAGV
jgi:hypothetical protein